MALCLVRYNVVFFSNSHWNPLILWPSHTAKHINACLNLSVHAVPLKSLGLVMCAKLVLYLSIQLNWGLSDFRAARILVESWDFRMNLTFAWKHCVFTFEWLLTLLLWFEKLIPQSSLHFFIFLMNRGFCYYWFLPLLEIILHHW